MRRKHNPDWYKLTKLLQQKGKINTGLTLPYIFGVYKYLGKPLDSISKLLDELRKDPIDKYPVIQKCGTIHQHVVAVEEKQLYHKNGIKDVLLRNANNEINLVISSNTDLGKTGEAVYKNLTHLYKTHVEAETFSWDYIEKKWMPFEQEEIKLILSIK